MAAPQKPWEKAGVNSQNQSPSMINPMAGLPETSMSPSVGERPPCCRPAPPTIPNRTSEGTSFGPTYGSSMGYGSYGSSMGYGGYGSSMYGGYGSSYGGGGMYGGGMYGGYGGGMYGSTYNRLGGQNENYNTNSFVQQAEQSSRQAFQSVESVVQAFGSIAMMLDSTFYAVYNSFRAVLGVADQFSRVKAHFGQILSALAVIRTLRWFWRKLLVLLRLRQKGLPEDVWSQAAEEGVKAVLSEQDLKSGIGGGSNWPIFLFFAMIFGGPWLLWKLLSKIGGVTGEQDWASGADEHFGAVAEYDFISDAPDELSFKRGDRIVIAPKELQPRLRGWLLASVDGKKTGVVPANYIKILGKRKGTRNVQHPAPKAPCCSQQKPTEPLVRSGYQSNNALDYNKQFPINLESSYKEQSQSLEDSYNHSNMSSTAFTSEANSVKSGVEQKSASDILDTVDSNVNNEDAPL